MTTYSLIKYNYLNIYTLSTLELFPLLHYIVYFASHN